MNKSEKQQFLGNAHALRERATFYKAHGWNRHSQEVEEWIETSVNVLDGLSNGGKCWIDVTGAMKQLAFKHGGDNGLLPRLRESFREKDEVKLVLDKLMAALDRVIDDAAFEKSIASSDRDTQQYLRWMRSKDR